MRWPWAPRQDWGREPAVRRQHGVSAYCGERRSGWRPFAWEDDTFDLLQPRGTQNNGRTGELYCRLGHARSGAAERHGGWTELADRHEYDDRTGMHVSDDVGISHHDGVSDDDGEAARHHNDNRARWLDQHDSAAWHDHDDRARRYDQHDSAAWHDHDDRARRYDVDDSTAVRPARLAAGTTTTTEPGGTTRRPSMVGRPPPPSMVAPRRRPSMVGRPPRPSTVAPSRPSMVGRPQRPSMVAPRHDRAWWRTHDRAWWDHVTTEHGGTTSTTEHGGTTSTTEHGGTTSRPTWWDDLDDRACGTTSTTEHGGTPRRPSMVDDLHDRAAGWYLHHGEPASGGVGSVRPRPRARGGQSGVVRAGRCGLRDWFGCTGWQHGFRVAPGDWSDQSVPGSRGWRARHDRHRAPGGGVRRTPPTGRS